MSSPLPILNGVPYHHENALRCNRIFNLLRAQSTGQNDCHRAARSIDALTRKAIMACVSQVPQRRYALALLLLAKARDAKLDPVTLMYLLQSQLSLILYL